MVKSLFETSVLALVRYVCTTSAHQDSHFSVGDPDFGSRVASLICGREILDDRFIGLITSLPLHSLDLRSVIITK